MNPPKQVMEGQEWPGLGQQWHVRVLVNGKYLYTTIIVTKGQRLVDRVRETRKVFKRLT